MHLNFTLWCGPYVHDYSGRALKFAFPSLLTDGRKYFARDERFIGFVESPRFPSGLKDYEGIARSPRESATLPRGPSMVQTCVPCVAMHEAISCASMKPMPLENKPRVSIM
jgi:hypothetical protein